VAGICAAFLVAGAPDVARAQAAELAAVADTTLDARRPHRAFGSARTLRLSASPRRRALLRFDLRRVPGPLAAARLRLHVAGHPRGRLTVQPLAAGARWSERRTTFDRAPRTAAGGIRSDRLARGWVEIDVAAVVTAGRRADLGLAAPRATLGSRESSRSPVLVVTTRPPPFTAPPVAPPPASPPPAPPTPAPATLTITQDLEPDDPQRFSYTGTGLTLEGDDLDRVTLPAAEQGDRTITQSTEAGWTLTDLTCTGDDDAVSDLAARAVRLHVDPGEEIACHFTSRRHASVTVVQETEPAGGGTLVGYTGTLGAFTLAGDGMRAFELGPDRFGAVGIALTPPIGWSAARPACAGDADAATTGHSVSLDVDPGETIECRFGVRGWPAPIAGIHPETSNRLGPFIDGNGNLYTVDEVSSTLFRPAIRRSTDGGRTWQEVGGDNRPTVDDLESVSLVQDGTRIHMLHQRSGYRVYYNSFNTSDAPTSPDSWVTRNVELFGGSTSPMDQSASLAVRGNGDLVAFYVVSDTQIAFRTKPPGGDWAPPSVLDTAGAGTMLTQVFAERGTVDDTIHVAYKEHLTTSGQLSRIFYRTLGPDGVLSPRVLVGADAVSGSSAYKAMPNRGLVVLGTGRTDRVHIAWRRADGRLVGSIVEGGVAGPEQVISDVPTYQNPLNVLSNQVVGALAPDAGSGMVRAVFADAATHDLWADAGAWGADAEILDDTDVMAVSANVYTHSAANGGGRVLGIVFDRETMIKDEGAVQYAELSLP
jgi:hypothetical protein